MIVAVPVATAITEPLVALTLAILLALVVQVPPLVPVEVYVAEAPTHSGDVPETVPAFGSGLTVTNLVATSVPQLVVAEYDIVADPADNAVTSPVVELTEATAKALLLQAPPASPVEVYVAVAPTHNGDVPDIVPAFGEGVTFTGMVAKTVPHVLVWVYVIVAEPEATPLTEPLVELTLAILLALVVQVPPVDPDEVYVAEAPTQSGDVPVSVPALGSGRIVIVNVSDALPQKATL